MFSLFSRRKVLPFFFPGAFNIKLVDSFILVWHSDYELSSKSQKPFFILKESSKCHNINYRAKSHVMFVFVCNRSRASLTRTRPTSTHLRWRVKEIFSETFKSELEKKNVIHRPRSVRIGRSCDLGLSPPLDRTQDLGHSFSQYRSPSGWIT